MADTKTDLETGYPVMRYHSDGRQLKAMNEARDPLINGNETGWFDAPQPKPVPKSQPAPVSNAELQEQINALREAQSALIDSNNSLVKSVNDLNEVVSELMSAESKPKKSK